MTSPLPNTSLHFLDFIIVILYIVIVLSIGWWYSLRQENAKSYFLGSGNINSFFVGISLYVTLFSTTSYLAIPGEIIKHGPAVLFGVISVPFSYAVISYILIPTLMKNRVVSAYELLDDKLGITCRRISACLFIFLRIIWMAVMMYLAATAISVILGMGPRSIIWIIIITGIISIAYTSIGGLQAVVITDFLQFVVLFGGAVCTIVGVTIHLRGFNWIPTQWSSDWDVQPIFSLNPTVRATLFGAFLMQFLYFICSSGSDQTQIQRYMATTNVRAARNAVLIKSIASVMTTAIVGATGFAILGFYQSFPEALPTGKTVNNFADSLFPFFITSQLPSGIAGFVVSALLAAAMSSVDSGVNSITAVVMRDLLPPQWRNKFSTLKQKKIAVYLALIIGCIILACATQVGSIPGNFKEVISKTSGLLTPILFGVFFLALFVPYANGYGAITSIFYGFATGITVGYWDLITGYPSLSYQSFIVFVLIVQIPVGCIASLAQSSFTFKVILILPLIIWVITLITRISL